MSCNGCRVLRKGCSESCILRPCLQWIETPESQGHATVFVAKFFGRAGLMSFISNVPSSQRPALFQSLLYEACGRTVNPVSGAVGLLWTGNWHVCQAAVDTVLRGGTLRPIPDFLAGAPPSPPTADTDDVSEVVCPRQYSSTQISAAALVQDVNPHEFQSSLPRFTNSKRSRFGDDCSNESSRRGQLDLSLIPPAFRHALPRCLNTDKQRPGTPSLNSEESATTISLESSGLDYNNNNNNNNSHHQIQANPTAEMRLLNLFV